MNIAPDVTFFPGFGRWTPQDKEANGDSEAHAGEHRDFLYVHRVLNRPVLSTDSTFLTMKRFNLRSG